MLLPCISSERLLTLTACSCVCILGLINYTSKLDNILISSWGHQKPIPGNFEQILSAEAVHNLGSKQPTNRKHIYVWLDFDILQRFSWPRSLHQSQYKDSSLVLILSFCLEWTCCDAAAWCLLDSKTRIKHYPTKHIVPPHVHRSTFALCIVLQVSDMGCQATEEDIALCLLAPPPQAPGSEQHLPGILSPAPGHGESAPCLVFIPR